MSQVRDHRARRGGDIPASAGRVSPSSEESSSTAPIPWERQQQTRNLKNLFYNVCEDKRDLKRRCDELIRDKAALQQQCDTLSDSLHTAEEVASTLRSDSHELRYFEHISLKAMQRARRLEIQLGEATENLERAAVRHQNQVDQAAADSDRQHERIDALRAELERSFEARRRAREGDSRRLAVLQQFTDEYIDSIKAELERVRRESEAASISHERHSIAQAACISHLLDRISALGPDYYQEAREAGIHPFWAAQTHVQHIFGPIISDDQIDVILQALTQRIEDLAAERDAIQAGIDELRRTI